jgi:uncharacterized protein YkwD
LQTLLVRLKLLSKNKKISTRESSAVNTSKFAKEALKAHNHYRAQHGVKPLKLENKISAIAQKVANGLVNSTTLKHVNTIFWNKKLGENMSAWSKNQGTSGILLSTIIFCFKLVSYW